MKSVNGSRSLESMLWDAANILSGTRVSDARPHWRGAPGEAFEAWGEGAWPTDPWRRNLAGTPPSKYVDRAWVQHMITSMAPATGRPTGTAIAVVVLATRCARSEQPTGAGALPSGAGDGPDYVSHGVATIGHAERLAQLEGPDTRRVEPAVRPAPRGPNDPVLELIARQGARGPAGAASGHGEVVYECAGIGGEVQPLRPRVVVIERPRAGTRCDDQPWELHVLGPLVGDDGQDAARGHSALGG